MEFYNYMLAGGKSFDWDSSYKQKQAEVWTYLLVYVIESIWTSFPSWLEITLWIIVKLIFLRIRIL